MVLWALAVLFVIVGSAPLVIAIAGWRAAEGSPPSPKYRQWLLWSGGGYALWFLPQLVSELVKAAEHQLDWPAFLPRIFAAALATSVFVVVSKQT